jgi:hypothetical protein
MTTPVSTNPAAPDPYQGPDRTSAARGFARSLERALASVDADAARGGADAVRTSDPQRLLELQSAIYRHAERVEIVSRLADHAVGTIKTILQTRV